VAIFVMSVGALAPAGAQEKLPPLRTGVDGTFAPHAFPKLGGGIQGFNVDLFTEVAKRMRREITIDSVSFSTLIPGMEVGRYDFIAAPTTVTNERAEKMLFTAGYIWTAYQFGIKKGSAPIKGWEDMKGKAVAVNKGTPYSGPSGAPLLEKDLPPPGVRRVERTHSLRHRCRMTRPALADIRRTAHAAAGTRRGAAAAG
jgi:ABC-type amino acid transport substrate-binding protein